MSARSVDQVVLKQFIEEAEGYLPAIQEGVDAVDSGSLAPELLEAAHRYAHTIRGTAAMVGLTELSRAAEQLEQLLLELMESELDPDGGAAARAQELIEQIESALQDVGAEEDPDPELLDVFALEAEEHHDSIGTALSELKHDPDDRKSLRQLRRTVHTLKGAAGVVGQALIAQLSHRMEDLLGQIVDESQSVDEARLDLMLATSDLIGALLGGELEPDQVTEQVAELANRYSDMLAPQALSLDDGLESEEPEPAPLTGPDGETTPDVGYQSTGDKTARTVGEFVRVPLGLLDDLVQMVSELVINRSAFEQHLSSYAEGVRELKQTTDRLRAISFKLESDYEVPALGRHRLPVPDAELPSPGSEPGSAHGFDDLEFDRYTEFHLLSRELTEAVSDVRTIAGEMNVLSGEFDNFVKRERRVSTGVQEALMRSRVVPLSTLAPRLRRTVRTAAREAGKQAELQIEGSNIGLDKAVLEELADPLLHLLRNAVAHGIEPPEMRELIGKSTVGSIWLHATREGGEVVLEIGDDGAGLEPELIRSAAVDSGLISDDEARQLPNEQILDMIFLPGLSTAGEVSEIAGRGIGLDVVRGSVRNLKGAIEVNSQPGDGTRFTLRLPLTLAVAQALLVHAGDEQYAVPLRSIHQVLRLAPQQLLSDNGSAHVAVGERLYPVLHLREALGLPASTDEPPSRQPALLLHAGGKQTALLVDAIVGAREIVVKDLGPGIGRVPGVSGATITGDGRVVLILDPIELGAAAPHRSPPMPTTDRPDPERPLLVMVVDDSLSVRRVLSKLIEGAGWEASPARDGMEALDLLQADSGRLPDVILVDIEMPRMDGYELMAALGNDEQYRAIPQLVLTSRAAAKHRRKAMEAGAAGYVVKPYQDEQLLELIRSLAQRAQEPVDA